MSGEAEENETKRAAAVDMLSSQDRRRLYFSTSSMDNFSASEPLSPQRMVECKGENFCAIHEMGKKSQKYLKYKPSQASFWQRTNCKYTEEFHPLPLGDYQINKALAKTFRPQSVADQPGVKCSSSTTTGDSYQPYSEKKMSFAKGQNFKPAQARHTSDDSKLAVTEPYSHTAFLNHRGLRPPESFAPKNQSHLVDPRLFTDWRTRYTEVFNREMPKLTRQAIAECSEDNSFRVNGSSVPNKVRDFFNLRRAFSSDNMPTSGASSVASVRNYNQGPAIVDILKMSSEEIKNRAESISEPPTSKPASSVGVREKDQHKTKNHLPAVGFAETQLKDGGKAKSKKSGQKARVK